MADDFNDNDFSNNNINNNFDDDYLNEFNTERKPANDNYDTFSLRTDPAPLLKQIELQLRNEKEEKNKEGILIRKKIPNTEPICNEQGIQEILQRTKSIINNHSVQGNQKTTEEHYRRMREIADSLTTYLYSNYIEWDLNLKRVNSVIDSIYFLTDIFLTRTLDNKERELYGETYKESTNRELKTDKGRRGFIGNALQKMVSR